MASKKNIIESTKIQVMSLPIHVPFSISRETLSSANVVVLMIQDSLGRVGLGEASPFPSLTGDTVEESKSAMEQFTPWLTGKSPELAMEKVLSMRSEIRSQSITAFTALEMALLDLQTQIDNRPLCELWGSSPLKTFATDITMPIMSCEAVENFWNLFKSHNFKTIKVKVSGHVDDDLAMILALVNVIPKTSLITLDGNQSYSYDNAILILQKLEKHNVRPQFFEQPLGRDDWQGLKKLSSKSNVAICLDETVENAEDAMKVVNEKTATMINLKIMKSGIAETLQIIDIAHRHNIQLMIGGMFETEIAMSTSLHLACGTRKIQFADLDTPFFFRERIGEASPWHSKNALLVCPRAAGHGVRMKPSQNHIKQL